MPKNVPGISHWFTDRLWLAAIVIMSQLTAPLFSSANAVTGEHSQKQIQQLKVKYAHHSMNLSLQELLPEDRVLAHYVTDLDLLTVGTKETLALLEASVFLGWDELIEDWGIDSSQKGEFDYVVLFPGAELDSEDYHSNSIIAFNDQNGSLIGYAITIYTGNIEESVSDSRVRFLDAQGYLID